MKLKSITINTHVDIVAGRVKGSRIGRTAHAELLEAELKPSTPIAAQLNCVHTRMMKQSLYYICELSCFDYSLRHIPSALNNFTSMVSNINYYSFK